VVEETNTKKFQNVTLISAKQKVSLTPVEIRILDSIHIIQSITEEFRKIGSEHDGATWKFLRFLIPSNGG
jgi:hypothetical protein